MCGGQMTPKVGAVFCQIHRKMIRVRNVPYNECSSCREVYFNLYDDFSSVAVKAYKLGSSDIEYFPPQQ